MDVSSRVLSELASREAALDAQIEAAREEAKREVEAAQHEAARILREAETRAQAMQAEFDQQLKQSPYFSLLPDDAKPQTDLNKEVMEKLRPEMRKFYLNKKANFK